MALVVLLLMTVLVPQIVSFIATMGQEMPLYTRALIVVSDLFVRWWYLILGIPLVLLAAFASLVRVSPSLRYAIDDLKLRLWVTGPILRKIILARFASCFALLYASGISVLDCVRIGESLAGNQAVAAAMRRAGRRITEGASLSAGFERSALFPPLVLRMLRVGESTGALDVALRNVSYFYERDVREAIGRLQTLIGPRVHAGAGGAALLDHHRGARTDLRHDHPGRFLMRGPSGTSPSPRRRCVRAAAGPGDTPLQ